MAPDAAVRQARSGWRGMQIGRAAVNAVAGTGGSGWRSRGGASSVIAIASGPIRVYLNSAISARGSRSSAWNCASRGAAWSARPSRCSAWKAP